jgi:hypothetical protein
MNIKIVSSALLIASTAISMAADASVRFMRKDGSQNDVIISDHSKDKIIYKMRGQGQEKKAVALNKLDGIYFYRPPIFEEALSLYKGRKYAEAKKKFAECQKAFKKVDTIPNNYSSLAGFYVLECSRRQFDLDALSREQEKFSKEGLTNEVQLQQLEVNAFWEAVRLKDWDRLDNLAKSWLKKKLPGSQRAQIAYCHGLALEQLGAKDPLKLDGAINAYNRALTADSTASMEIVAAAASNALRIYHSDPKVQLAITQWGTNNENKGSVGYQRLIEANALTKLYLLGGFETFKPLPAEYQEFTKYEKSASKDESKEEPKEELKEELKEDAKEKPKKKSKEK